MTDPGPVARALEQFPEHARIIGDMLLGFANLEFLATGLVAETIGSEAEHIGQAVQILYRLKGANDRLNVADAIFRPFMAELKLRGAYGQWVGAIRRCRIIRNQYAHCAWMNDGEHLRFADLQEAAQAVEGEPSLTFYRIRLSLLKEQQAYFDYTIDVSHFLLGEVRYRKDKRQTRYRRRLPKSRAAPKLHSPLD